MLVLVEENYSSPLVIFVDLVMEVVWWWYGNGSSKNLEGKKRYLLGESEEFSGKLQITLKELPQIKGTKK